MGGVMGTIFLGLFATTTINPNGANGLLNGGGAGFFFKELVAIVIACSYAFFFTYYMLKLLNLVVRVKVSLVKQRKGLDLIYHGEIARQI